jgi:segregation and condensation protein A
VFNVKLENFEGPLDLLLYFIKRDKIDIYDIPISKITSEYIDVINTAKKLDVSVAGEFLFMASLLLRLKTRMLLPRQKDEEGLDIDDPRISLVDQLLQYRNFKNIAYQLKDMHDENKDFFIVPMIRFLFKIH